MPLSYLDASRNGVLATPNRSFASCSIRSFSPGSRISTWTRRRASARYSSSRSTIWGTSGASLGWVRFEK